MKRADWELHLLPTNEWTREEVVIHLEETFDREFRRRPDLLEAYVGRMEGKEEGERVKIMRQGLAETFSKRWPIRKPTEV